MPLYIKGFKNPLEHRQSEIVKGICCAECFGDFRQYMDDKVYFTLCVKCGRVAITHK